jgi:two-component system sensor histidine kinase/response regulator
MKELSSCSVLVVDDTEANIDILVETLGDDYEVSVSMDGPGALEIAAEEHPDLILLDVMMPDMDGYEVCRRLKANADTSDIPVIFVTAKVEVEDETKGFEMGAVDYITKPISPAVVKARVKTHLSLKMAMERLELQNKELVEAANLREDVQRITHHDLKNPLTSILSVPMLLSMADNIDPDQKEMLKRVEESGYVMLNMINFSLDLFKIEQGVYQLTPQEVDVLSIVETIFREFEGLARSCQVGFSVTLDGSPVPESARFLVKGEELLCYSMLANLIKNAVEASPEGASVTVDLVRGDPAKINVHNVGAVPADIREKFFEKYSTSGKMRGTGLGTYSARLNAEVQGGGVSFTSSETEGTVVTVSLPV